MAFDMTTFKKEIEAKAYEIFFDSLPAPDEPWRQFVKIDEDTSRILVTTDSLAYVDELDEWNEGDTLNYTEPKHGYVIYGKLRFFRKGRKVSWHLRQITSVVDELLSQVKDWADAYVRTKNNLIRRMIEEGALTAGSPVFDQSVAGIVDPTGNFIYDGKPLFANDLSGSGGTDNRHPLKYDATQKFTNYAALPLTYENLLTVYTNMKENKVDDYGRIITIRPDTLLVPTALEVTARQLVEADFAPHDATTPSKPNPFKGVLKVVVWDELQHNDAWVLIDSRMGGIVVRENVEDVEMTVWIDNETKELRCDFIAKFGAYVRNWRAFYGCNLPQA